jgi:PPOX class probable F420-dependent enzyme
MASSQLSDEIVALLRRPVFAHVATVMADGTPQNTPVWIDTDGTNVIFNTAKGRVKHRNLLRDPHVAISLVDDDNPYLMVEIRGEAEMTEVGADDHIDAMAKKYLNQDTYPFRKPGEERIIVTVRPTAVAAG